MLIVRALPLLMLLYRKLNAAYAVIMMAACLMLMALSCTVKQLIYVYQAVNP